MPKYTPMNLCISKFELVIRLLSITSITSINQTIDFMPMQIRSDDMLLQKNFFLSKNKLVKRNSCFPKANCILVKVYHKLICMQVASSLNKMTSKTKC